MSFSKEISDFTSSFKDGWKLVADAQTQAQTAKHNAALEKHWYSSDNSTSDKQDDQDALKKEMDAARKKVSDTIPSDQGGTGGSSTKPTIEVDDLKNPDTLVDKIAQGESNGNYNALAYKTDKSPGGSADLSNMTIAQVQQLQDGMIAKGHASTAVGGLQITRPTLNAAVAKSGLDPNKTMFTPDVQKQLGKVLMKGRGLDDFQAGKMAPGAFLNNLAQEWASLPRDSGSGNYDGYNGNHATITLGSSWAKANTPAQSATTVPAATPVQASAIPDTTTTQQPTAYAGNDATQAFATGGSVQPDMAIEVPGFTGKFTRAQAEAAAEEDDKTPGTTDWDAAAKDAGAASPDNSDTPSSTSASAAAPQGAIPTDQSSSSSQPSKPAHHGGPLGWAVDLLGGAAEAVHSGLQYIQHIFGFDGPSPALATADPNHDQNLKDFAANKGAADPKQIDNVKKTVDPKNELSDGAKTVAAYYAGYQHYMNGGDPVKAQKYAAAMLMAARSSIATNGLAAQVALSKGNLDGAAKLIQDGHNDLPTGTTLQVGKSEGKTVPYKMFDEMGNPTDQGEANINQLMQMATGMRNGTEWFRAAGMIGAKSNSAQARVEADRNALNDFRSAAPPDADTHDYLSTLTPDQRTALSKMSPAAQHQVIQQGIMERKTGQKQALVDKDQKDQQEFSTYSNQIWQAEQEVKHAAVQSNGQDTDILRAAKTKLEAAQGAAAQWAQADPGRAKYLRQFGVQDVPTRGSQLVGATPGAALPGAPGGASTPKGAKAQAGAAIDTQTRQDVGAARGALDTMSDQDYATGGGQQVADNTNIAMANAAYQKVPGNGMSMGQRMSPAGGLAPIDAEVRKQFSIPTPDDKSGAAPSDDVNQIRFHATNAASKIMQKNPVSPEEAVAVVKAGAQPGSKLQYMRDGRVKIGNAEPVFIDRDSLAAIAAMRGKAAKGGPQQGGADSSGEPRTSAIPDPTVAKRMVSSGNAAPLYGPAFLMQAVRNKWSKPSGQGALDVK